MDRRTVLRAAGLGGLGLLSLAACTQPEQPQPTREDGVPFDLSPEQNSRVRSDVDPAARALLPESIAAAGVLTVGVLNTSPPLSFSATDDVTPIGSEVDTAYLVADKLGLELNPQVTSWENWPLKLGAHEYHATFANVGVTEPRLKLYDFATYRAAYMGFLARKGQGPVVETPDDISGRKLSVTPGTNQEKIVMAWNEQLRAQGKEPAALDLYLDNTNAVLALAAGRIDYYLSPFPTGSYYAATRDDLEVRGKISAGWPKSTLVAATTLKNSGLARPFQAALQSAITSGQYRAALTRWGLEEEFLPESLIVTEKTGMP
ncbi:transporter substrate-binding domain-containing protein [Kocuria sp. cx-455]|uniref:transporter substrate-binding domain-containing protein n=1 Tax=unclassified Candidatus Sulfotelmatobacter TaxID=2635724 RepID=UPI0016838E98|nr:MULTISPECIES: transporter substrate-binding domain-containing protein [unclassified Candidatus Sulfotelmatobacter]MBD2762867.1 transporter substrate-binding domain-containing protein [Kocuria sp. cx-116]MBD2765084.1 transporter substrate-binding domain-containing protein [Kocuria sp. cx-455]